MSVQGEEPSGAAPEGTAAQNPNLTDEENQEADVVAGEPPSLLEQVSEGWELLSEAAEEVDPDVGSLMANGLQLVYAAFEQQIDPLMDNLRDYLRDTELTPTFQAELIEQLRHQLTGPRSPFSPQALEEHHRRALQALEPGIDDPALVEERTLFRTEAAVRSSLEEDPAAPLPDNLSYVQEWRILATVDRPQLIGHDGSLYCAVASRQPQWRRKVRLAETTYQGDAYPSVSTGDVSSHQWVRLQGEGIPRDFDEHESDGFAWTILNNPDAVAYLLQLNVGGDIEDMVHTFITTHEAAIKQFAEDAVTAAKAFIPHLVLVPPAALNAIPTVMLAAIKKILTDRHNDRTMPSWLVQHTVLQAPNRTPISAITLRSPEQGSLGRATLAGANLVSGQISATEKYPQRFKVAQLWPRGRIVDGATQPERDAKAFPKELPTSLWEWVAEKRRPVVWSDAWTTGEREVPKSAFRALVPIRSVEGSNRQQERRHRQSYIAALRVEVYPND